MAGPESIDSYLTALPVETQEILERVRVAAHAGAPGAEETISYQMPTLRVDGKSVVHFAGWKAHLSLYPTPELDDALEQELQPYIAGKGTLKFPLDGDIPYELITRVVERLCEQRFSSDVAHLVAISRLPRQRTSGLRHLTPRVAHLVLVSSWSARRTGRDKETIDTGEITWESETRSYPYDARGVLQ